MPDNLPLDCLLIKLLYSKLKKRKSSSSRPYILIALLLSVYINSNVFSTATVYISNDVALSYKNSGLIFKVRSFVDPLFLLFLDLIVSSIATASFKLASSKTHKIKFVSFRYYYNQYGF